MKAPSMTTTTMASRTGLSQVPNNWIAGSTTEPGVARMIPSETATIGASRTLSPAAMAWLTARPARPANTPAEAQAPRVDRIVPMYSRICRHERLDAALRAGRQDSVRSRIRHDVPVTSPPPLPRVGIGTDVHRLADGVPMYLAGLAWPDEPRGLAGHSDGDVAAHAAVDASACQQPAWGTSGATSVRRPRSSPGHRASPSSSRRPPGCASAGFEIGNVAINVIGNAPRLGPRRAEAEAALSAAIGAPVTVSATTTDGLGLTGRGEGVAAIATALITPREVDR